MLDIPFFLLYNCVTILNECTMTVTTNEYGQQNMFAKEPTMYTDKDYTVPHNERAELLNGRLAMLGFVAAIVSYALTGQIIAGVF